MLIRFSFNRVFILLACAALFSSGCQKLEEYIHHPGDTDYTTCNIKKLSSIYVYSNPLDAPDSNSYIFTYNELGKPVSVTNTRTDRTGTGNPNYTFIYDKKNRLVQFVQPYTNGIYEKWDKYGYNNKGQIVYDTNYVFGPMAGNIPMPADRFKAYIMYEYDAEGRIKHETGTYYDYGIAKSTSNIVYNYDAAGNLITGAVYDNKLSIYRTNAVWMFIAKDYSINNAFKAVQYNDNRLPLHFKDNEFKLVLAAAGSDIRVEYMCH